MSYLASEPLHLGESGDPELPTVFSKRESGTHSELLPSRAQQGPVHLAPQPGAEANRRSHQQRFQQLEPGAHRHLEGTSRHPGSCPRLAALCRPEILLVSVRTKSIITMELTVPLEDCLGEAYKRKRTKYEHLVIKCRAPGWKVQGLCPLKLAAEDLWVTHFTKLSVPWASQGQQGAEPSRTSRQQLRKPRDGSGSGEDNHGDKEMPPELKPRSDQPRLGGLSGMSDV